MFDWKTKYKNENGKNSRKSYLLQFNSLKVEVYLKQIVKEKYENFSITGKIYRNSS